MSQSVYVIAADDAGPCKIGVSVNPRSRMATLQTGNAAPLKLVAAENADGTQMSESRVHEYLKGARLCGEWFGVDACRAQNAVTAMLNWGDELSGPRPDPVRLLARDVEAFCPPNASVETIVHLALLIAQVPEHMGPLLEHFARKKEAI